MIYSDKTSYKPNRPDIIVSSFARDDRSYMYREQVVENLDLMVTGEWAILMPLVPEHPKEFLNYSIKFNKLLNIYYEKVISEPVNLSCSSASFDRMLSSVRNNPAAKKLMIGKDFKPRIENNVGKIGGDREATTNSYNLNSKYDLFDQGIINKNYSLKGFCTFQLPDYSRLVTDCSKMKILFDLLSKC